MRQILGFPQYVAEAVFKFIFSMEKQIFKESFQKYGSRGNLLSVVVVIGPNKCIAEIPGVTFERLVVGRKSEFAQIEDSKD